jgi:hypothetical protein
MEDDGSISLKEQMEKWRNKKKGNDFPLSLAEFFAIAIELARILEGLDRPTPSNSFQISPGEINISQIYFSKNGLTEISTSQIGQHQ